MPSKELDLDSKSVPVLAPFVRVQTDRITGEPMLLAPENALILTDPGVAILGLCDGQRSLGAIVLSLAEEYDAPDTEILADVRDFLARLSDKGYVRWAHPS